MKYKIGIFLENEREKIKITQKQMADKLGISLSTYRRIVNGDTEKLLESIELLKNIYRITGKMMFQVMGINVEGNAKLRLINIITELDTADILSIENYVSNHYGNNGMKNISHSMMQMAMEIQKKSYYKIAEVNLTTDTYTLISVRNEEWKIVDNVNTSCCFSELVKLFVQDEGVHPDDAEDFLAFANISVLKRLIQKENNCLRHKYRRKVSNSWRNAIIELIRSTNYSENNQSLMMYIREDDD